MKHLTLPFLEHPAILQTKIPTTFRTKTCLTFHQLGLSGLLDIHRRIDFQYNLYRHIGLRHSYRQYIGCRHSLDPCNCRQCN